MNRTLMTLLVKFVITFAATWISIGLIAGNPIGHVLAVSFAVIIVNYIAGDLLILPAFGNTIASIADGIMGIIVALLTGLFFEGFQAPFFSLFVYGVLLVIGQFFFHAYLIEKTAS